MSWSTGSNGNFTQSNLTLPWIPLVVNGVNVERSSEAIRRFQHLTTFRRYNFISHSVEKHGNYLFHYINDGEIVLERYFSKKDAQSHLQLLHQPSKNLLMSSLSSSSLSSTLTNEKRVTRREVKNETFNSKIKQTHVQQVAYENKISLSNNVTDGKMNDLSETRKRIIRSPVASDHESTGQVYIRTRFVLFANLAKAERVRDFRDKFHSGSIRVTSNPKRMRDFLYLRSLKLDPGEAIIAQVE